MLMKNNPTPEEIAWLAGLLDGEGCFDFHMNSKSGRKFPRIRIQMKDLDVIKRVKDVMGGGQICKETGRKKNHSTTYILRQCKRDELAVILPLILPWMSKRRAERIKEMIEWCN